MTAADPKQTFAGPDSFPEITAATRLNGEAIMRTVFSLIAVSVIAFNAHGASPPDEARRKAELQEAVDRFGRAYLEADVPVLRLLLADNYVHVNGSSGNVLNRSVWLDWVGSRRAQIDNEELQITEYRVEDVESVIHGDTAIVIGTVFSSQLTDGVFTTSRIRFTNTWLYRDAKWLRASFHDSALP